MAATVATQTTVAMTGNSGCALAMKQINPDVVAAYPITPQTTIVEEFANYVANGQVDTEYINVESEHSAMSACIGAAAAGARVITATSSQGLALMWEELSIASALRLPIVMHNVNRALSGPLNIHCDHSDSMGARDMGWIHLFSENAQEAYDNTIMAVRIAEHTDVQLPVMVLYDGFIISHAIDRFNTIDDASVKAFVGDYNPSRSLLNLDDPMAFGPFVMPAYYMEQRMQMRQALMNSKNIVLEISKEYGALTGRTYGLFEEYKLDDADYAIVVLGSTAGTAKYTVDAMRSKGVKAGVLIPRLFRPFPSEEMAAILSKFKAVAVMDRADSIGAIGGPVYMEVKSALYGVDNHPPVVNYVYGLGGREIGPNLIERVVGDLQKIAAGEMEPAEETTFLGVKE